MRTVELAKVATAAEALRLRRIARRQAFRAAYGAVAAVFALAVLIVLHFLIYVILARWMPPPAAIGIVLLLDLIVAGVFGYLAIQSPADSIELEAQQIRVQAMIELKRSLTVMGLAAEAGGLAMRAVRTAGVRRGMVSAATRLAGRITRR